MRILVGNDYYDRAMKLGHDRSVIYVREKQKLASQAAAAAVGIHQPDLRYAAHVAGRPETARSGCRDYERTVDIRDRTGVRHIYIGMTTVIFCGNRWNGMYVQERGTRSRESFWDFSSFKDYISRKGLGIRVIPKWNQTTVKQEAIEKYFRPEKMAGTGLDYLIENKIVSMTCADLYDLDIDQHPQWCVNMANLKDFQFYKVFDAFQAYQEISQWVGGVLTGPGNQTVEITDDRIKAEKHGFDRWSFRKMPTSGG